MTQGTDPQQLSDSARDSIRLLQSDDLQMVIGLAAAVRVLLHNLADTMERTSAYRAFEVENVRAMARRLQTMPVERARVQARQLVLCVIDEREARARKGVSSPPQPLPAAQGGGIVVQRRSAVVSATDK